VPVYFGKSRKLSFLIDENNMSIINISAFIAAVIILIGNKEILNFVEKKYALVGKPFDRQKAFMLTMVAVGILILKGLFL
jgi:hypothetical protein